MVQVTHDKCVLLIDYFVINVLYKCQSIINLWTAIAAAQLTYT